MKKIILSGLILATVGLTIVSCNKERIKSNLETETNSVQVDLRIKEYINESASDDLSKSMYTQLYELTIPFKNIMKNGEYNESIINYSKKSWNNSIPIETFIELNFNERSNEKLAFTLLQKINSKTNLASYKKNKTDFYTYTPSIHVFNYKKANYNELPIIAFNMEISTDIRGMEDYEDCIIAWKQKGDGTYEEIILDEKTANEITNPIFIIDNAQDIKNVSPDNRTIDVVENRDNPQNRTISTYSRVLDQYKISQRYDNSSKSEYSYELIYIKNGGGYQRTGNRTEIKEIHKNDLNTYFTNDFSIYQLPIIGNLKGFDIFTFEYDWWASNKTLRLPGQTRWVKVKMSNSGDYYQYGYVSLASWNWTNNFNTKGAVKIQRK